MRKIAVFGSRQWPANRLQEVGLKINALYAQHGQFILVSGFADGPSAYAEATAQEFGMPVISFRPVKLPDNGTDEEYGVDEWRLYHGKGQIIRHEITWANWTSAAGYRSMLIAERAEEGVAYWDGFSHGTSDEIDYFAAAGKTLEVIRP